ncbi:AAA family ATPase [Metabacillus fastidiosus]|uniref:AAA family ATPase n=1 Tax=Metabacillus fastidiosus TaxID=1458 RepID=UPI003D27971A
MNLTVNQAVWLAAAMITYERFKNNQVKSMADIALVQADIQKRAQSLTNNNVESARISQHFNADHQSNTQNYFRNINGNNRRLSYPGEFNGIKERPDLNFQDSLILSNGEQITVDQLVNFVETEYRTFIDGKQSPVLATEIDFKKIITHLNTYANHDYKSPHQLDEHEKQLYLAIRESGSSAVKELNRFADSIASKYDLLNKSKTNFHVPKQVTTVRSYLWNQLVTKEFKAYPTSLSIFAEKKNDIVRFRLAIELDEKNATTEDFLRHHQFLTLPITLDPTKYFYYVTSKDNSEMEIYDRSAKEIKEKVETGEYKKVQLCYAITNDDIIYNGWQSKEIFHELIEAVGHLLPYYNKAMMDNGKIGGSNTMYAKNNILYGPPGTGKTYTVIEKAVNIIDPNFSSVFRSRAEYEEAYQIYIEKKQIQFCTFHQSFSYEDFVEGLRSDIDKEGAPFTPQNGVFKEICELAKSRYQLTKNPTFDISQSMFYKISLGRARSDEGDKIYRYCIANKVISLGHISEIDFTKHDTFEKVKEAISDDEQAEQSSSVINMINNFRNELNIGDLVIISKGNLKFRAIAKVTGDYYYDEETEIPYNHFREVEWLYISNSGNDVDQILNSNFSQLSIYPLNEGQLKIEEIQKLISAPETDEDERFVLIIDEINRGNISKIFGELITLIEEDKRFDILEDGTTTGIEVILPYSKEPFSVPKNVYLLGTMNTADRSISFMDTALRRRFMFEEMLPNPEQLGKVGNVDVGRLLKTINERIEYLYDRDHQIGHAFFIGKETTKELIEVMQRKVIPLLQEYFYDDWEKIELVLGGAADSETEEGNYFLFKKSVKANNLFKKMKNLRSEKTIYTVVKEPSLQALLNIYQSDRDDSYE